MSLSVSFVPQQDKVRRRESKLSQAASIFFGAEPIIFSSQNPSVFVFASVAAAAAKPKLRRASVPSLGPRCLPSSSRAARTDSCFCSPGINNPQLQLERNSDKSLIMFLVNHHSRAGLELNCHPLFLLAHQATCT